VETRETIVTFASGSDKYGSTQALASEWLLHKATKCLSEAKMMQRYSLAVFYLRTHGDNWVKKEGWMSIKDECDWYGISCDEFGITTELILSK
jgi:hypothetical protein